jgi:hypothetical protein
MSNLLCHGEKKRPISEAEELDSFLAGLERGGEVKDLAGWKTGFASLDRALNGVSPGLYLLIGPPACGKTAFAKQLLDQAARENSAPALFFTLNETKADLRIRTLARLSGLETRDIRCGETTTAGDVEQRVHEVRELKKSERILVVIKNPTRKSGAAVRLRAGAGTVHRSKILNQQRLASAPDDEIISVLNDLDLEGRLRKIIVRGGSKIVLLCGISSTKIWDVGSAESSNLCVCMRTPSLHSSIQLRFSEWPRMIAPICLTRPTIFSPASLMREAAKAPASPRQQGSGVADYFSGRVSRQGIAHDEALRNFKARQIGA